jgi:hypothetical protein
MNTTFLLLPKEYEKNEEEKYFSEISRKDLNVKNKILANNLLLFMMIHDLRELLLNNKNSSELIINNVEKIYKKILESITLLLKQNERFREIGYHIFLQRWKSYNEQFSNVITLGLIKEEIMNTTFILLPKEYEKNEDEKYFSELSRKDLNNKNKIFANNLYLFMMIHDLREILLNNKNASKLIKDKFPLHNNEDIELNINAEYEFKIIESYKNYKRYSISYKLDGYNNFIEGELILINKYIYFGELIDENKFKIKYKFKMNLTFLYKDNTINKDNEKGEISLIHFVVDEDLFDNENKDDEDKKTKIIVKFRDEKLYEELSQYIIDKNFSINNDEILAFTSYFEQVNNDINEEDF